MELIVTLVPRSSTLKVIKEHYLNPHCELEVFNGGWVNLQNCKCAWLALVVDWW